MVQPIVPKYFAETANTSIGLAAAPVELRYGAVAATGAGKACLELSNRTRVVVEVETTLDGYRLGDETDLQMKFGLRGRFIPVIAVKSQISNTGAKL